MTSRLPAALVGSLGRLAATLHEAKAERRGLLSVYLTAGFPDGARSRAAFQAVIDAGASWVELGIPFSDPVADGPVLQHAARVALRAGATVDDALRLAADLRRANPLVPIVAMTYGNIVHRRGWTAFASALAEAGLDGLIVPDVPHEEAEPLRRALASSGLAYIPLVTPATPTHRMAEIAKTSTGFLYVVANVGVTGQSDPGPLVAATVARAREAAPGTPLVVGFGVRTAGDVRSILATGATGVIVGSHIVATLEAGQDVGAEVRRLVEGTTAARE